MVKQGQKPGMIRSSFSWFKDKIKSRDMFGIPISLNFEGENEFKTGIGGWISSFVTIIVLIYAALLLKTLIAREDSSVVKNTIQTDLTYDVDNHYVGEKGFNFGVALVHSNGTDILNDQSLATVTISQVKWLGDEIGDNHTNFSKELTYQLCNASSFPNLNEKTLTTLKVFSEYYCPTTTDYVLSGNLISTKYNYIKISVKKWSGQAYCQSSTAIDDALKNTNIKIAISNSYFDVNDYSNPVHHFYDDELRWKLVPGYKLSKYVQMQHNKVTLQDSPVPFSPTTSHEFYTAEKIIEKFEYGESGSTYGDEVFEIRFRLDTKSHTYERKVFSFSDMMGLIGGVMEVLTIGGAFIVGAFSQKMYTAALLNKLYQVESDHSSTSIYNQSKIFSDENAGIESVKEMKPVVESTKTMTPDLPSPAQSFTPTKRTFKKNLTQEWCRFTSDSEDKLK
jgi:hypothetical protein